MMPVLWFEPQFILKTDENQMKHSLSMPTNDIYCLAIKVTRIEYILKCFFHCHLQNINKFM